MLSKNRLQTNTIRCPKCQSSASVKDGVIKEKQRFKCKECNYHYTVLHRGLDVGIRRQAVQLYLAGFGSRAIARLLQCSHVTVTQWVNEYGETLKPLRAQQDARIIKTLDLQNYVKQKKDSENGITLVVDQQTALTSLCIPITGVQTK